MAFCKFRHLVPVQYFYPSASVSSFPHTLLRYFVCGALAEASSSGELEKATQASNQEATEVLKTEEASHNPDLHWMKPKDIEESENYKSEF